MRPILRTLALGIAAAALAATPASAAAKLDVSVSGKRGQLLLGNPFSLKLKAETPDTPPTTDGNQRIKAIRTKLPADLYFNPTPFRQCNVATFLTTRRCPSSTKIGTASIVADGGPEVGRIRARATIYFGSGYSALARVIATRPAAIDETIVGQLRSSGSDGDSSSGYGLELYLPVSPVVQEPLPGLYPTLISTEANVKLPSRRIRTEVPGSSARRTFRIPLAGLGDCRRLNFQFLVEYTNAGLTDVEKTDGDSDSVRCR